MSAAERRPDAIFGQVMLAFSGMKVPDWMPERLRRSPAGGSTLYRYDNVETVRLRLLATAGS